MNDIKKEFAGTSGVGGSMITSDMTSTPTFGAESHRKFKDKIRKAAFAPDAPNEITGKTFTNKRVIEPHKIEDMHDINTTQIPKKVEGKVAEENNLHVPKTPLQNKLMSEAEFHSRDNMDQINRFLKGYEKLALLAKDMPDEEIEDLYFGAQEVSNIKQFSLEIPTEIDRLEMAIYIDSVAHELHSQKNSQGFSEFKILDDLADIAKNEGESNREDRLIILSNPKNVLDKLTKMNGIEILSKGKTFDKGVSFWKIFEKTIKSGVKNLTDEELILVREFLFARV